MFKFIVVSLVLFNLLACQNTSTIKSFNRAVDTEKITEEEDRLWHQAKKFDSALFKSESLYNDVIVNKYIQGVMDRIFPQFKGKIKVRLINDPYLNAFALPNGSIYFNVGLLARLDNEAQLATILAHEGAHFVHKHGLKQRRRIKSASAFALIFGAAGGGVFAKIAAASSIYGYSRDLEREADAEAFINMKKAGYDISQSPAAFQKLLDEAKAHKHKRPWFFASHPKLQDRIDNYKKLIKEQQSSAGSFVGITKYKNIMHSLRIADLQANLSFGRYKSIILILEKNKNRGHYPSFVSYYLGEAYRRRADKGDNDRSEIAYLKAITAAPEFAPSYKAIGIHYMKDERYVEATESFLTFIKLAPKHKDIAYIQQYLENIKYKN